MTGPELALHHQRLDQRVAQIRTQIERLRALLAGDPAVERLEQQRAGLGSARRDLDLRLREQERQAETRRLRLRSRQRELMSGRLRNPTELLKLQEEVDHLRETLAREEDVELETMAEQEQAEAEAARLEGELAAARERSQAEEPELRRRLERLEAELVETESEREKTWLRIPDSWQSEYMRIGNRRPDPVAEVVQGQCQACRVGVTSSGMQVLRRAGMVLCDNCGRLLVVA